MVVLQLGKIQPIVIHSDNKLYIQEKFKSVLCDLVEEMRCFSHCEKTVCDCDAAKNAFGKKKSCHNWQCLGDGCREAQYGSEVDLLPGTNTRHP